MHLPLWLRTTLTLPLLLVAPWLHGTEVRPFVSPMFSDNMVLQRDKPNTIWGWTVPGQRVRVGVAETSTETIASADGYWSLQFQPPPVGTTCIVRIAGPETREFRNVIVGDVWLCSGQSNMQWGLPATTRGAEDVAAADHPEIRLFTVPAQPAYSPRSTTAGHWRVCSPESVAENGGFSAVAYFFARRVQAATGVPIGVIQDALGGTPIECWMSPEALTATGLFERPMAEIARLRERGGPEYGNYVMHWYDQYDRGIQSPAWFDPSADTTGWREVTIPGAFAELGLADAPAVVWFRKEIDLADPLPPGPITLHLGVVEKMDTSYVNGEWVGASSWVENPRAYRVSPDILRAGRNVLAVRVLKLKSQEGFLSAPEGLSLAFADGSKISLAGSWQARVSVDARPPHPLPLGYENYPIMPTVLYHGMIRPVVPLALRGFLWYQGEANAERAHHYRRLLPAMIRDWRRSFAQGDLPFLIAGLPAFQARKEQPSTDGWAELREAQLLAAQHVPRTAVATLIDTGDADDIHPRDKQPVGERLALLALKDEYGQPVLARGPQFAGLAQEGPALRLTFNHFAGGLELRGPAKHSFAVCGADGVWHWADARLDGDTVVVQAPEVPEPREVRYAWQANPEASLFNRAGLPAAPFRTDDQPGVTADSRPW